LFLYIEICIHIAEKLPVQVIEENAILEDSDLSNIEKYIIDDKEQVYTYFRKELMFLRKNFHSKEETLKFLSEIAFKKGLVDDTLLDAIYKREEVAPTAFGNFRSEEHRSELQSRFDLVCRL